MAEEIIVKPKETFVAKRVPVSHRCECGHSEDIVPPCAVVGVMYWTCLCGRNYRMEFQGRGPGAGHNLAKAV
jgi:hypothetical protein